MPDDMQKLAEKLIYPLMPWIVDRLTDLLPQARRLVNPIALASSPATICDIAQARAVTVISFTCSIFVATTNNGTNYWTIKLADQGASVLSSFDTSGIAAGTWTRFAPALSAQPGAANVSIIVQAVATGAPGAVYVIPEVRVKR